MYIRLKIMERWGEPPRYPIRVPQLYWYKLRILRYCILLLYMPLWFCRNKFVLLFHVVLIPPVVYIDKYDSLAPSF